MEAQFTIILALCVVLASAQLPQLNIDMSRVSVSGVSSGGYMAVQFHMSFSETIKGAGIFAAGPFHCSQGNVNIAVTSCMTNPALIDVNLIMSEAKRYSDAGQISPITNIQDAKVLLFSGSKDTVVHQGVVQKLELMYQRLGADVDTEFYIPAEHAWITDSYGSECAFQGEPFINNCEVNGSLMLFRKIYGNYIVGGSGYVNQNLMSFSQDEYKKNGYVMNEIGHYYVPTACKNGAQCGLHIAFHGCKQTSSDIGDAFITKTQLNEIAEANNFVILYPQATHSAVYPYNPEGCWDWWGYTDGFVPKTGEFSNYPTQRGKQIASVWNMVLDLAGLDTIDLPDDDPRAQVHQQAPTNTSFFLPKD